MRVDGDELVIVARTGPGRARSPATRSRRPATRGSTTRTIPSARRRRSAPSPGRGRCSPDETAFLGLGPGAERWLIEAAAAGTERIRAKMARAIELAALVGTRSVDEALAARGRGGPLRRGRPRVDPRPLAAHDAGRGADRPRTRRHAPAGHGAPGRGFGAMRPARPPPHCPTSCDAPPARCRLPLPPPGRPRGARHRPRPALGPGRGPPGPARRGGRRPRRGDAATAPPGGGLPVGQDLRLLAETESAIPREPSTRSPPSNGSAGPRTSSWPARQRHRQVPLRSRRSPHAAIDRAAGSPGSPWRSLTATIARAKVDGSVAGSSSGSAAPT